MAGSRVVAVWMSLMDGLKMGKNCYFGYQQTTAIGSEEISTYGSGMDYGTGRIRRLGWISTCCKSCQKSDGQTFILVIKQDDYVMTMAYIFHPR